MRSYVLMITLLLSPCLGEAKALFPTSPLLEKKIKFWERIFGEFTSEELVIHDRDEPHIIIDVIDVSQLGFEKTISPGVRKALETQWKAYLKAVSAFASMGADARDLSPIHKKIWVAYQHEARGLRRLLNGRIALRTQGGLADTFEQASENAKLYLPKMEKIFKAEGLPTELTRLPFVESMFNVKARSKVGASGIWQLMPHAARPHILVNRRVDQRNSPLLASKAAARIMRQNYKQLGDWSLAITAYNHGLGGVKRAVHKTGSRSLDDIITSYRSPSFGFASSNFYAEFVAALRTHSKLNNVGMRPSVIADAHDTSDEDSRLQ